MVASAIADVRSFLDELGIAILKERGAELECRCPLSDPDDARSGHLHVNAQEKPGVGNCKHADCPASAGFNAVGLAVLLGCGREEARDLAARYGLGSGRATGGGRPAASHSPLTIAELARSRGVTVAALESLGVIEIAPFTTPKGKWIGGGVGVEMWDGAGKKHVGYRVRARRGGGYNLPADFATTHKSTGAALGLIGIKSVAEGKRRVLCEGETTCAAGRDHGLPTVATPGASCFKAGWCAAFVGCDVEIPADADHPGHKGAARAYRAVLPVASSVQIVRLPYTVTKKCGRDLRDFLQDGGSAAAYDRLPRGALELLGLPADDLDPLDFDRCDEGNARLIIQMHGQELRYLCHRKVWLHWEDGLWWTEDHMRNRVGLALAAAEWRLSKAPAIADPKLSQKYYSHALRSKDNTKIEHALAVASALDPIRDDGEGWNADPLLLGCLNGVVDLHTGKLRPGRPEDRISKHVPLAFRPDASSRGWEQFLLDVFDGSQEMVGFVWRLIGYTLTGLTHEHVLVLLHGSGRNGKTTLLNVLRHVFGEFAVEVFPGTLEADPRRRGGSNPTPDVVVLRDARLGIAREVRENVTWDEERLKRWAGGDPIQGRDVYEKADPAGWRSTAKLWLAVNHLPKTTDDSPAFWERMILLPFGLRFMKPEALKARIDAQGLDPATPLESVLLPNERIAVLGLEDALVAEEAEGILAWAVRGAVAYAEHGLQIPEAVRLAVDAYHQDQEPVAAFVAGACAVGPGLSQLAGELFRAYERHCSDTGVPEGERLSIQMFGRVLGNTFRKKHTKHGQVYQGLAVRAELLPGIADEAGGVTD